MRMTETTRMASNIEGCQKFNVQITLYRKNEFIKFYWKSRVWH